jgi:galactose mutarotase-like enzyme
LTTTIKNTNLIAEINPFGAELISLKNNDGREYIWEGNPDYWGKHSPILFPIVGTLKNNSFQYKETKYELSRHGFAREMPFNLIRKTESKAAFSIKSNDATLKKYPFYFELQLIYSVEGNSLTIEYKVINCGKETMPFSIGAHPAFALPQKFEHYSMLFEQTEPLKYYLLENDLICNQTKNIELNQKQIPLTYELFKNDALIFKTLQSKSLTVIENSNPLLKVSFEDFPSLGIWTKMNAPFLCIEPWFGYSDTDESNGNLFEKEGIQLLEEKKIFHSKFQIEIL